MNIKTALRCVVALCMLVLFSGCAVQRGTINNFYEPSYKKGSIKTLAVPAIRNARLAPSESQQIGRAVNQAVATKNPSVKLVSANKFANLLNENKLVDDYADFIEDYITSGIANNDFLRQLRNHGIDAIMLTELSNVYQQDGTYAVRKGQSRVTLGLTIIDTRTNDVVWTASADGIKGTVTTVEQAPPLIEAINLAVEKIKTSVPEL